MKDYARPALRPTLRDRLHDAALVAVIVALFTLGFWATSASVDDERIRPDARGGTTHSGHSTQR
jgi:hypothetical protein